LSLRLIQTKFFRPQTGPDLVPRPRLLERLDEGLSHELILVSAPAGSGKTTLASQWLDACGRTSAWLSLDERDNDLPHLLRYVCAAVCHPFPEACADLQDALSSASLPGTDTLVDLLVDELNKLPGELVFVLDDYHRIRAPEVHHALRQLLRYPPPRLHLVLLTRSDPPLALGRLRLGQRITEIRAADLRFDLEETRILLQDRAGRPLDDALLQTLQARTEGWAIGLQLAAISLQSQTSEQLLAHFGGSHRLLAGYLVEEVMGTLAEAVTAFLTRTALLDRFCAPLGDALLAGSPWPSSSQATMAWLEEQNLFVISIDDQDSWFRYHDLFRDFLLHRLKTDQGRAGLAELHHRAGEWLAQADLIDDALRHLLAAGDEAQAAELVETHLHPLINQDLPAPVLARWLDLFPELSIQAHPGLLIAQAYLRAFHWDLAAMAAALDRAEALVHADGAHSPLRSAMVDGLRGYMTYWQGDAGRAIPLLRRALPSLDPVTHSFTHTTFLHTLAEAYINCGQRKKALDLLQSALAEAIVHRRPTMVVLQGARTLLHLHAGELDACADASERMLALADSQPTHPEWSNTGIVRVWRGWACYLLGVIHYEQNDLEAAASHWRQVEAKRYRVNSGAFCDSMIGLALVAEAQGEAVQALAYAQAAHEYALELRSPPLLALAEALSIRLALSGDQTAEAFRHAHAINTAVNQGTAIWLERPGLAVVRALLAEATPSSLAAARQLAETCLGQAQAAHNTRQVIQAAALYALAWHAQRRTPEALGVLEQALSLAEPGGFLRTFLDLGVPMAELLRQYERRADERRSSSYIKHLLAVFARELDPAGRDELAAQYVQLYHITPLTKRELEMLDLIAQRLTYREIAERLVISPNTVKKHVSNIYGKLGVSNRPAAIAKAQESGLLASI
jgi:LuxR family maltose regulon positive regulatory protein